MSNKMRPFPIPLVTEGGAVPAPTDETVSAEPLAPIPGIEDVVLVASGKGGVGKSTVAINLACALQQQGRRVGILDADLYGPSIVRMLGTDVALEVDESGRNVPACGHGVWSVSVANVLPPEAALVWKGPLVAQTLVQMFREVAWPELDILLVDLPPGTGDVQLTIVEQIPVSGAVIVTSPQKLALADAERGISLFHELDIPVFGVVENMSGFVCPCCGEAQPLFPDAGAALFAARRHVRHLGRVPLDPAGQRLADSGRPIVVENPDSVAAEAFSGIATKVSESVDQERRYRQRPVSEREAGEQQAFWEALLDD